MWNRTSKYGAIKTEYNGVVYASKHEARVAADIELMRRSGTLVAVETQKSFELYGKGGNKICVHRPDFLLTFNDGHEEVWEAKGQETPEYRLKLKLFIDNYPQYDYFVVKQSGSYYAHKKTGSPARRDIGGTTKLQRAA
jgi:hypothetical protein